MINQFEEKGKIFTSVISKQPVDVIIQTVSHRILGKVHIRPSDRLIDELNKTEQFIAVTDARILTHENIIIYEAEFITVNSSQIIWILPLEELQQA
jgi:hypothetical protein